MIQRFPHCSTVLAGTESARYPVSMTDVDLSRIEKLLAGDASIADFLFLLRECRSIDIRASSSPRNAADMWLGTSSGEWVASESDASLSGCMFPVLTVVYVGLGGRGNHRIEKNFVVICVLFPFSLLLPFSFSLSFGCSYRSALSSLNIPQSHQV